VGGQSGIDAIHIPCSAIRDYFFAANRKASWQSQPSFYYLLHLPTDVPFKELRLGYRIRRMELLKQNASKAELAIIERAYNMLADPDLRSLYNELRKDPTIPVPFPYSGFGSLLVQGERTQDVMFSLPMPSWHFCPNATAAAFRCLSASSTISMTTRF
jgi:hypothetical protein